MHTNTELRPELWIGGEWRPPRGKGTYEVVDPATGQVIGAAADACPSDVDSAVTAARSAFEEGDWPELSGRERSRILFRVSALIREHVEELAEAESRDVGKPISFARAIDVATAADQFEYFASLAQHLGGDVRETPLPAFAYTRREPHGVIAAISPFNFPLILGAAKLAAALAAGNTVVHKPATLTPFSAQLLPEIFVDAGLPAGVYNLVTSTAEEVGSALVEHPGVDAITFTGSTKVGRQVARSAGELLKPTILELGGNGANLVFADADLDSVLPGIISGFVFNTGQFCMSGSRLLVQRDVYEQVLSLLADAVPQVPIGRPSDPATVIGPLISAAQLDRVASWVDEAVASGARVVTGGERYELGGGYYYRPTVRADVRADSGIVCEEVFGPVLTVQAFEDEAEAILLANGTPYGLAAGVQTSDISRANRVSAALQAGIVWVNTWGALDPAVPFGGVKNSGWGRESGPESLHSFLRTKSVMTAIS